MEEILEEINRVIGPLSPKYETKIVGDKIEIRQYFISSLFIAAIEHILQKYSLQWNLAAEVHNTGKVILTLSK